MPSQCGPTPVALSHESSAGFEIIAERIRIPTGQASLDGVFAYPLEVEPVGGIVVAGPHPLMGGEMENNVVESLANGMAASGFATLRFNYAGVGASEGADYRSPENLTAFWDTSHTSDENVRWRDLEAAVRFIRLALGNSTPTGIAAYSFGNYVTASWLANLDESDPAPDWIFCVAPTVNKHDLGGLANSSVDKFVIAPADDFATPLDTLVKATDQWQPPLKVVTSERDGHFFRGHESWLCSQCLGFSKSFNQDGEPCE